MPSEAFEAQAALLVRALPYVAASTCFALKGGTAINLFVRNLPRLSVDMGGERTSSGLLSGSIPTRRTCSTTSITRSTAPASRLLTTLPRKAFSR